jgi:hypothetical protein
MDFQRLTLGPEGRQQDKKTRLAGDQVRRKRDTLCIILGNLAVVAAFAAVDPWLCVPAFRRVCQYLMTRAQELYVVYTTTPPKTRVKGLLADKSVSLRPAPDWPVPGVVSLMADHQGQVSLLDDHECPHQSATRTRSSTDSMLAVGVSKSLSALINLNWLLRARDCDNGKLRNASS